MEGKNLGKFGNKSEELRGIWEKEEKFARILVRLGVNMMKMEAEGGVVLEREREV